MHHFVPTQPLPAPLLLPSPFPQIISCRTISNMASFRLPLDCTRPETMRDRWPIPRRANRSAPPTLLDRSGGLCAREPNAGPLRAEDLHCERKTDPHSFDVYPSILLTTPGKSWPERRHPSYWHEQRSQNNPYTQPWWTCPFSAVEAQARAPPA